MGVMSLFQKNFKQVFVLVTDENSQLLAYHI